MKQPLLTTLVILALSLSSTASLAKDASETIRSGFDGSGKASVTSIEGRPLEASAESVAGAALIVIGLAMGADDVTEVSVQNAKDGSKATFAISTKAVQKLGVAVGQSMTAVSEATGYSLMYSGQILAFVPNAVGASLLEHTPVSNDTSTPATAGK
ncbi:hypothetical protein [Silvimonas iriomotensis]|uniref:Uncharacterized protein n=1 Tax=Silvimonas iriomotensis TaxID=449662 RepID=A0ABQ2P6E2_9NEIS|nr:hypothetical protein [Silvimonas iriomotensis]GGP19030.1 hypothetical protein GCM10010970_08590 [Silvimonas iriomotensis]